ncbi:MAG: histidine kinase N-terminal 7TM domain-containing protein [Patescibacteria group bacterium]|mgnify:CR=1 FL=1
MLIGYILILISLAELVLGIFLISRYQRSQAKIWYGLFCIAIAIYVGGNGLGYLRNNLYIAERVGWVGGILTAIFILPFSFTFPLPRKRFSELWPLVIWPAIIFVPAILATNILLNNNGEISYRLGYSTLKGPYFWAMLGLFGVYWVWALINLFWRRSHSDGIHRWQLNSLLLGIVVSLVVSVTTDIIFPLVTKSTIGYVGSLFSAVWLGFTAYIILRK